MPLDLYIHQKRYRSSFIVYHSIIIQEELKLHLSRNSSYFSYFLTRINVILRKSLFEFIRENSFYKYLCCHKILKQAVPSYHFIFIKIA